MNQALKQPTGGLDEVKYAISVYTTQVNNTDHLDKIAII